MADAANNVNGAENKGTSATSGANPDAGVDYKKLYEAERSHAQKFEEELNRFKVKLKDNNLERVLEKANKYDNLANKVTDPEGIEKRVKEIESEIEGRYSSKLTEKEKREQELQRELNELRVVAPATQEAAKHFTPDGLKLIAPLLKAQLAYDNGEIIVVDSSGKPRPSKKDPRIAKMPLNEFIEELAAEYPSIALNKAPAGGKTTGGMRTGAAGGTSGASLKTLAEIQAMPDKGRAYLRELAKQEGGVKLIDKILSGGA